MNANVMNSNTTPAGTTLARGVGISGRTTVAATMLGGLLLGGVLVAWMTLQGRMSGHGIFVTASGLFVIGALLGLAHGAVLGYLGRAPGEGSRDAVRAIGRAAMYSILGAAVSWLLTVWVALSAIALFMGRIAPLVLVGVAWIATVFVVVWAMGTMARALRNAYARWEDRVLGTVLVSATFAALLVLFLAERPELWLVRFRVTEVGAVLLAGFATLWIAGPVITFGLRAVRELPGVNRIVPTTSRTAAADVGVGLVAGLLVGLMGLALPSNGAADAASGGIVVTLSQVLVNETLLRLFVLTGVAWLILRWHGAHREEVAVLAILVAAAAQVVLYLPGVLTIGFPSALAAVTFTSLAVVVPALLFGAVYWTRGFTAALVADATAALAILMIV